MYKTNLKLIKTILLIMMAGWNLYAQGGKLSGFITDQETGEALIGANVFIVETGNGMSTDKNGYYVLQKISSGNYILMVSYIGYATLQKEIIFGTNESMRVEKSPSEHARIEIWLKSKHSHFSERRRR